MLGRTGQIVFSQEDDYLLIEVPKDRPTPYAVVLKVEGVLKP